MNKTQEWPDQIIAVSANQRGERLVMVVDPDASLLENVTISAA